MASEQLQIERKLTLCVFPSASRRNDANFKRNIDETTLLDHTEAAPFGPVNIPASSSFSVPFEGLITGRFLYLESNQEIRLVFNGGAEWMTIKPLKVPTGQSAKLARVVLDAEFTSLSIENPAVSGEDASVTGYIFGD